MTTAATLSAEPQGRSTKASPADTDLDAARLARLYDEHFTMVWRGLRRLGVPVAQLEDAAHDVFLVVQRRLSEFEGRSSISTWLYAIVIRIAAWYRRSTERRSAEPLPASLSDASPGPHESAARAEAARLLYAILDELPEERRTLFVLAELEELPVPEIARITGVPLNTAYSRLRLARRDFEEALRRARARDGWRSR